MKSIVVAASSVVNAVLMFVFVDGLYAVGRYDGGVKWVMLQLPFAAMVLSIAAILVVGKRKLALAMIGLAAVLFLPLFLHECLPGIIGWFDAGYRSAYGDAAVAPFFRFDPLAFAIVAIFLFEIVVLSRTRVGPVAVQGTE